MAQVDDSGTDGVKMLKSVIDPSKEKLAVPSSWVSDVKSPAYE